MARYRTRIEGAAEALSDLRYLELQTLGNDLAEMANTRTGFVDDEGIVDGTAMANLLADWAGATEAEYQSEKE